MSPWSFGFSTNINSAWENIPKWSTSALLPGIYCIFSQIKLLLTCALQFYNWLLLFVIVNLFRCRLFSVETRVFSSKLIPWNILLIPLLCWRLSVEDYLTIVSHLVWKIHNVKFSKVYYQNEALYATWHFLLWCWHVRKSVTSVPHLIHVVTASQTGLTSKCLPSVHRDHFFFIMI